MDSNKAADEFLDSLRAREFIPEEDVAWVSATYSFLCVLDGEMLRCPIRDVNYKKYKGVEFRESQWAGNGDFTGRFAWNISKRTKDLFNWEKPKGQKNA